MPLHWTYDNVDAAADLEQGDILRPTDDLLEIFGVVHPHFKNAKYLGFLVATQSCDLVIRADSPKASYINLAAIRPLSQVAERIFGHVAEPAANKVFRKSHKPEVRRLLERLFNQNEQAIGLFFLHADADAGIAEPAVAFLRVTVALRADHYEILRGARTGRLMPAFRAKLGWMIGNLYGRPATPDWGDNKENVKAFENLVTQYINEARWIDDEIVARAKSDGIEIGTAAPEVLEALRPPSALERALDELEAELSKVAPETPDQTVKTLQNRLRNNGKFRKLFRP